MVNVKILRSARNDEGSFPMRLLDCMTMARVWTIL
jgi:hypothetical protein